MEMFLTQANLSSSSQRLTRVPVSRQEGEDGQMRAGRAWRYLYPSREAGFQKDAVMFAQTWLLNRTPIYHPHSLGVTHLGVAELGLCLRAALRLDRGSLASGLPGYWPQSVPQGLLG